MAEYDKYHVGVARVAIPVFLSKTMQGYHEDGIFSKSSDGTSFARAFIIQDAEGVEAIFVVVDIWSCTRELKDAVVKKVSDAIDSGFITQNENEPIPPAQRDYAYFDRCIQVMGTHTHSMYTGYTGVKLFQYNTNGYDENMVGVLSSIISAAIQQAYKAKSLCRIYKASGRVVAGYIRSREPHEANQEVSTRKNDPPYRMQLLAFVSDNGDLIGCLNWFPIHPNSLGQFSTVLSGDSKGWAARTLEQIAPEKPTELGSFNDGSNTKVTAVSGFVAGFANSNAGDISPNNPLDDPPFPIPEGPQKSYKALRNWLELNHTKLVYEKSNHPLRSAIPQIGGALDTIVTAVSNEENRVSGPVLCLKSERNLVESTLCNKPALGLSMLRGSSEDSQPNWKNDHIQEGLTVTKANDLDVWKVAKNSIASFIAYIEGHDTKNIEIATKKAHYPKPVFIEFSENEYPYSVPLQIIRIGNIGIAGIPAELTIIAGQRLAKEILSFSQRKWPGENEISEVMLSCYANDYTQYVTTYEEYRLQHYEGASTPYGPHTLNLGYTSGFRILIDPPTPPIGDDED